MKKLLFLVVVNLMTLSLLGCNDDPPANPGSDPHQVTDGGMLHERIIENCQYLELAQGQGNYRVYALTHKGNCTNPIHAR